MSVTYMLNLFHVTVKISQISGSLSSCTSIHFRFISDGLLSEYSCDQTPEIPVSVETLIDVPSISNKGERLDGFKGKEVYLILSGHKVSRMGKYFSVL